MYVYVYLYVYLYLYMYNVYVLSIYICNFIFLFVSLLAWDSDPQWLAHFGKPVLQALSGACSTWNLTWCGWARKRWASPSLTRNGKNSRAPCWVATQVVSRALLLEMLWMDLKSRREPSPEEEPGVVAMTSRFVSGPLKPGTSKTKIPHQQRKMLSSLT